MPTALRGHGLLWHAPVACGSLDLMNRRRLMLVVSLAALVVGLAWWLQPERPSAEEQRLVGTWHLRVPPNAFWPSGAIFIHDYGPDRKWRLHAIDGRTGAAHLGPDGRPTGIRGRWRVQNGDLACDWDHGFLGRIRRMLPAGFPGAIRAARDVCPIEWLSADEMVLRDRVGNVVFRLTRATAD